MFRLAVKLSSISLIRDSIIEIAMRNIDIIDNRSVKTCHFGEVCDLFAA